MTVQKSLIISLAIVLTLCLGFTLCADSISNEYTNALLVQADTTDNDPTELLIEKEKYSNNETMTLTIVNRSTGQLSFGRSYSIQQFSDGEWQDYPLNLFFTMDLILLQPGKTFEQLVQLEELETGRYRITKKVMVEDTNTTFELSNEFEITGWSDIHLFNSIPIQGDGSLTL